MNEKLLKNLVILEFSLFCLYLLGHFLEFFHDFSIFSGCYIIWTIFISFILTIKYNRLKYRKRPTLNITSNNTVFKFLENNNFLSHLKIKNETFLKVQIIKKSKQMLIFSFLFITFLIFVIFIRFLYVLEPRVFDIRYSSQHLFLLNSFIYNFIYLFIFLFFSIFHINPLLKLYYTFRKKNLNLDTYTYISYLKRKEIKQKTTLNSFLFLKSRVYTPKHELVPYLKEEIYISLIFQEKVKVSIVSFFFILCMVIFYLDFNPINPAISIDEFYGLKVTLLKLLIIIMSLYFILPFSIRMFLPKFSVMKFYKKFLILFLNISIMSIVFLGGPILGSYIFNGLFEGLIKALISAGGGS